MDNPSLSPSLTERIRQLEETVQRLQERDRQRRRAAEIIATAGQPPGRQSRHRRDRHGLHLVTGIAALAALILRHRRVSAAVLTALAVGSGTALAPAVLLQPAAAVPRAPAQVRGHHASPVMTVTGPVPVAICRRRARRAHAAQSRSPSPLPPSSSPDPTMPPVPVPWPSLGHGGTPGPLPSIPVPLPSIPGHFPGTGHTRKAGLHLLTRLIYQA